MRYDGAARLKTAAGQESELPQSDSQADMEGESIEFNTEAYDEVVENEFLDVLANPQSTFSVDVDTASYSNVRRLLNDGRRPPRGAVRIEELVNYFSYEYTQPDGDHPFSVQTDIAACPWNAKHQLVRIALAGKKIEHDRRPPCNLVFLLDVSGSMNSPQKLPLVKSAMQMLVSQLNGDDRVAIVVYAGGSGLVLPSTSAGRGDEIMSAIDQLEAGGSTNAGEGIELAYKIAQQNLIDNGSNRVILCTDGDFNVGVTNQSDLVDLIKDKAKNGVFLSVFGFGSGNLKDSTMERLADNGNGNYGYIDNLLEARKSLVEQIGATLITIAKDVKIQIDFNPKQIVAYRLIGYENRLLANEDFEDDAKDAGEIGAGHTVTSFYEVVPVGVDSPARTSRPSKFVENVPSQTGNPNTLLTVSLRYKRPDGNTSTEFTQELSNSVANDFATSSIDFKFASAVAGFGMLLRDSKFSGDANWDWVIDTAEASRGEDRNGFRAEFVMLAKKARLLATEKISVSGDN